MKAIVNWFRVFGLIDNLSDNWLSERPIKLVIWKSNWVHHWSGRPIIKCEMLLLCVHPTPKESTHFVLRRVLNEPPLGVIPEQGAFSCKPGLIWCGSPMGWSPYPVLGPTQPRFWVHTRRNTKCILSFGIECTPYMHLMWSISGWIFAQVARAPTAYTQTALQCRVSQAYGPLKYQLFGHISVHGCAKCVFRVGSNEILWAPLHKI